jgi:hypothetical protein
MKQFYYQKKQGLFVKMAFAILFAFLSVSVKAQTEVTTAKTYLNANTAKYKLTNADINDMIVSSSYLSPTTGWYHVYFNQNYQSVDVYNGLLNMTLKAGNVEYVANSFVPDLATKVPAVFPNLQINPVKALQNAAVSVNLTASTAAQIQVVNTSILANGIISKASYIDKNLSNDKIEVKLYWLPYEAIVGEKAVSKVTLTYDVRFLTKNGQNSWNIHVDALTGNILQKYDEVIHCDFGKPEHLDAPKISKESLMPYAKDATKVVAPNTYNVFDYPLEAPTFGSRTPVSSPYTRFAPASAGPPGSATNGWHDDGTTQFTNTKGNNVDAKDDIANDNEGTIGSSPNSATLDFNFPYTQATGTSAANLNAAITNLFYWNNVMHDVLWKYGFDEPSGNFQKNNLGRGGAGNDFVFADAQDGSGTDNANFSTPVDGGNGRMQMFIWSNAGSPLYTPDSDFDNGVIAHEYGHGWSIRLTGGPAVNTCLQNAEQGGEGWSDYAALMLGTDWSALTPSVASANIPRGIGTYVLGEATTGAGIRPFRYSYDKATYNNIVTYAGVGNTGVFSQPHGIGSIWATMLWDMTWEIILQDNQIVNNIYTVPTVITNMRGNIAALKLVNEGLRLQACSPSFVQARDAILQADQLLFGGRYKCSIWKAFARRGLGFYASTGASTNDRIVTEDFTPLVSPALNSALTGITCSNQVFTYTATTASVGTFTYAWTRAAVAGISNPASSGSSANVSETLINTTSNAITVQYIFTISPDECGGTPSPQRVNVVVNPSITPTVATYTVCQNATVPVGEGLAVAASVPTTTVNGTIVSGPTYVRGSGNNVTTYTADRPVFYKTYTFVAPSSGSVTLATTAAVLTPGSADDTYLTLYQTTFNPANPATNFLRGDDDTGVGLLSSLTQTLTSGTTYIVVVSTFNTGATGTFTLQASTAVFGQTVNWYLNASGGSPLATGAVFNPVGVAGSGIPNTATAGSTNFYVADAISPDCRTLTTFIIGSQIAPTGTNNPTICSGTSASLSATCASGTPTWYNASSVAIPFTGSPYSTPNLSANTTYNVRCESGACLSPFTSVLVTVGGTLTAPTGTNNPTICTNTSASLSATCASGTPTWYNASSVAIPFTGSPYTTPNLSANTTYNVRCENGACLSPFTAVTVTVGGALTAPTGTNNPTICTNTSASLSATCASGSVVWYNASSIAIPFTGSPYATPNLLVNTSYNVRCENGACLSPFTAVTVTIGGALTAPTGTANAALCGNVTASLSASCASGSVVWYDASGITSLFTGSPFVTPTLSANTTYKVRCENGACLSSFVDVAITVNPIPIVDAGANQTICAGNSASLSATCTLYNISTTLNGTSQVPPNASTGTGNVTGTFNSATNQLNLTIVFSNLNGGAASAAHIHNGAAGTNGPVIIPFAGFPAATSGTYNYSGFLSPANATALLAGNTYVNIHDATFPGGEIRGQLSVSCVANSFVWNPGALSGQSVSVTPAITTTYTVTASNTTTGCSATATTMVTVIPALMPPTANGITINTGTSASLSATCVLGTPNWYDANVGGSLLGVGSYATPNLTVNTTYYVACESGGSPNCVSSRTAQTVTVNTGTGTIITQPVSETVCVGQTAYFNVVTSGTILSYQWQENRGIGWNNLVNSAVYVGVTTANLVIFAPTIFMNNYQYRCIVDTGSPTPSTAAILNTKFSADGITVIHTSPIVGGVVINQAVLYLIATNKITSNALVDYRAGSSIALNPGFEVQTGSVFRAKIERPCTNTNAIPEVKKF